MHSVLIKKIDRNSFVLLNNEDKIIGSIKYTGFSLTYLGPATITIHNTSYCIFLRMLWLVVYIFASIKLLNANKQEVLSIFEFKNWQNFTEIKQHPFLIMDGHKYRWSAMPLWVESTNGIINWKDENDVVVASYNRPKKFVVSEWTVETTLSLQEDRNILLIMWGFYLMPKHRGSFFIIFLAIMVSVFVFLALIKTFVPLIFN